jgi:hypothetical protein
MSRRETTVDLHEKQNTKETKTKMKKTIVLSMVAAFATGCATGPGTPVADAGGATARELKIAVFTGNGARNAGAFRWLEIATMSKGVEAVPVDGVGVEGMVFDEILGDGEVYGSRQGADFPLIILDGIGIMHHVGEDGPLHRMDLREEGVIDVGGLLFGDGVFLEHRPVFD